MKEYFKIAVPTSQRLVHAEVVWEAKVVQTEKPVTTNWENSLPPQKRPLEVSKPARIVVEKVEMSVVR